MRGIILKSLGLASALSLLVALAPAVAAANSAGTVHAGSTISGPDSVIHLAQAAATDKNPDITTLAPPKVTPVPLATAAYSWAAEKADGSVTLTGHVPDRDTETSFTDAIDQPTVDKTEITPGAPSGFAEAAVGALEVLATLDSGKVAFDGTAWTVTGAVDSADKATAAASAFAGSPLKALGARYDVTAPVAAATVPASPAPSADYAWSAEKAADGGISFAGTVPSDRLKNFLDLHAGGKATDKSTVAAGAPKDFVGGALYGLDALLGLDSGKLAFAGGTWTLSGTARDAASGKAAVGALDVIDHKAWKIDIATAPAVAAAAPTPAAPAPAAAAAAAPAPTEPYTFDASKPAGGAIALSGEVPTEGARGYFGGIAGNVATDGLKVAPNPPADFITNALAGLDALGKLSDGDLSFDGTKWTLKGKAANTDARAGVLGAIAALPTGKDWTADVSGPSELEICTGTVTPFVALNPVNFDRGAHFAKGTDPVLDTLAADLAQCPNTRVDIQGNTDSDGNADANMALSVARAEAVVDALVKRGVKAERLYAIGYGETLPLVPNTTKANKAKNRRIDFKFEPLTPAK